MCSKSRPHPAPMPALGKLVGEHTMLYKSSLHQKKKIPTQTSKKQPASQDASRAWRSGTLFDIMMRRKKSLGIGAGKPNSGLSFISGLCVTLDKSTYLLGSFVSFLAKWKGWSVGGKKRNVCLGWGQVTCTGEVGWVETAEEGQVHALPTPAPGSCHRGQGEPSGVRCSSLTRSKTLLFFNCW